jgi:hypothetical protein
MTLTHFFRVRKCFHCLRLGVSTMKKRHVWNARAHPGVFAKWRSLCILSSIDQAEFFSPSKCKIA